MQDQPKPRYTNEGLPIVTQDIADTLFRDLVGQNPISNEDLVTRINSENPLVANYIANTFTIN